MATGMDVKAGRDMVRLVLQKDRCAGTVDDEQVRVRTEWGKTQEAD